jgi:hypothetical protein
MLSPEQRTNAAPALADAFGTAFWVAVGLIAATLVPALLLPRPHAGGEPAGATAAAETGGAR